jgi:hypothetical protein
MDITFAIIENDIVVNSIVAEHAVIAQGLLPGVDLVEVTSRTGHAYIGGPFVDGIFFPPKPFESWVMDPLNKIWKAPIDEPAFTPGSYHSWNEENQQWDIEIVPIIEQE